MLVLPQLNEYYYLEKKHDLSFSSEKTNVSVYM